MLRSTAPSGPYIGMQDGWDACDGRSVSEEDRSGTVLPSAPIGPTAARAECKKWLGVPVIMSGKEMDG